MLGQTSTSCYEFAQERASGSGSCSFAPIARALSHLPDEEKEQLRRKFDIAYFIALEKLSSGSTHVFVSWKLVIESRSVSIAQGINLGTSLKNCPTTFEKWPIKIDFALTNGLPNF